MKNLKVAKKLLLSFMIVIALTIVVGSIGIIGMQQIASNGTDMYRQQLEPIVDMGNAREMFQRIRVQTQNVAIYSGELDKVAEYASALQNRQELFLQYFNQFKPFLVTDEGIRMASEVDNLYNSVFLPGIDAIIAGAKQGSSITELMDIMANTTTAADQISENLDSIISIRIQNADDIEESNSVMSRTLLTVIIAVLAVAIVIAVFLAIYISKLISKPLNLLCAWMKNAAETGEIVLNDNDRKIITTYGTVTDEIGETINYTGKFISKLISVTGELKVIAEGDLSQMAHMVSDKDTIGHELNTMLDKLNSMFGEINNASGQVSSGSRQISEGAQMLAQGSTEQAASVEQLSSSISEIAQKTKTNAEMAIRAATLAEEIKSGAVKGSKQMDNMVAAVNEISEASQNISKVIKVIDDIAFQTNILALNAAVEAARAGQHGKGFAVVAEEVRNLAAKSAEAAKETGNMIQNSMAKAELGSKIAGETADSLHEIVTGINESTKLVSDIAKSSDEQSIGIAQINTGIDQVAHVVQQNSATAEESAAASEEMSGQATVLGELVEQFKLRGGSGSMSSSKWSLPTSGSKVDDYVMLTGSDALGHSKYVI